MKLFSLLAIFFLFLPSSQAYFEYEGAPENWVYDEGPDASTTEGAELIKLNANIPYYPGISEELLGNQKFRAPFGPIPWRMLQKPNSVKILFIGQDGTHIAEAAGRPATAGFGGRAHDLANYFGVDYSAAFINTYAFTIYGQYGEYGVPVVYDNSKIGHAQFQSSQEWMMSQGELSPITQWRNALIDWIIWNNKDSLKMIVTFGGSAKDSISSYIISKGGAVGTNAMWMGNESISIDEDAIRKIKVPKYRVERTGGNGVFPVPVDSQGRDLYKKYFAKEMKDADLIFFDQRQCSRTDGFKKWAKAKGYDVTNKDRKIRNREIDKAFPKYEEAVLDPKILKSKDFPIYSPLYRECDPMDQQWEVKKRFAALGKKAVDDMVFEDKGRYGSGIISTGQINGYDPATIKIKGQRTINLNGIELRDGSKLNSDVLVVDLPHPSALSRKSKSEASKAVNRSVKVLVDYAPNGWKIDADDGQRNQFHSKMDDKTSNDIEFEYGRGEIGQEYYDFGTPGNRMVSQSDAKRLDANVILLGARDDPYFYKGMESLDELKEGDPATWPSRNEMYVAMSRTVTEQTNFDPGPGEYYAKLMKNNLDLDDIMDEKSGMEWGSYDPKRRKFNGDGNAATNIKSHPKLADYAHYRGTFDAPKVLILADPAGWDDVITARALTGIRGQYLQGLMEDIDVPENYLVLKTVPFGMDDADSDEWGYVLQRTNKYRKKLLDAVLKQGSVDVVMTDGQNAKEAWEYYKENSMSKSVSLSGVQQVEIERSFNSGADMKAAAAELNKVASGQPNNIPGAHLSYYARVWEGTTGDRVVTAEGKTAGLAFAEVVPYWVSSQEVELKPENQEKIDQMKKVLCENKYYDHCN